MNEKRIISHVIETLYGACPVGDFVQANDWAAAIDWEKVRDTVAAEYPGFQWAHMHAKGENVAEAAVFDVRHEMLRHAGHEVPK